MIFLTIRKDGLGKIYLKKYLALPLKIFVYEFVWDPSAWLFTNALWGAEVVIWGGGGRFGR